MEYFSLKEAVDLIGDGATYRTIDYYKNFYGGENDVLKKDRELIFKKSSCPLYRYGTAPVRYSRATPGS